MGRGALARRPVAIDHQHRQRGILPPGADPGVRAVPRQVRRTTPRKMRAAASDAATLIRMTHPCRSNFASQRDRALLLLLAAGLARTAIVTLQAEQLHFIEVGLALTVSPNDKPPQRLHLSRSTTPALSNARRGD